MKTGIAVIGAALSVMLLLGGCSDKDAAAGGGTNGETARAEQGTVQVGDVAISSKTERPPNFPKDIPLPNDSTIVASMEQAEGSSTIVFDANQSFEDVVRLYKDYVSKNGYSSTMPVTEAEDMYWFAGSRNTEHLVIILNKDLERKGCSSGTLTYQKKS